MDRRLPALALACVAVLGSGCGGGSGGGPERGQATLVLDFQPNAIHGGIYLALSRDYDQAEGLDLEVQAPSSSTDAIKLLLARRADAAILDIHDLAIARAKGSDVVGVMALVQKPLAAVMAQPSIRTPKDLEGRRVGVSGLPSDVAVLRSIVAGAGGDPDRVRQTTIGFNAVPALLGRRVAGATAFWNAEGVALRAKRPDIREFRVDAFGAPGYPELVLSVARRTLTDDPGLVRAIVASVRRGYQELLRDPEAAVSALVDAEPDLERDLVTTELDAVQPVFTAGASAYGELDRQRLAAWSRWESRFGIVEQPVDVARAFAPEFSTAGIDDTGE